MKTRIEQIMQVKQLTPAAFAKIIQVNPSALSHILNGRNQPSLDVVRKILKIYPAISPDWLLWGEGTMYRNETDSAPNLNMNTTPNISTPRLDFSTEDALMPQQMSIAATQQEPQETPLTISAQQPEKEVITPPTTVVPMSPTPAAEKKIERIMVFFEDNVYQEFLAK